MERVELLHGQLGLCSARRDAEHPHHPLPSPTPGVPSGLSSELSSASSLRSAAMLSCCSALPFPLSLSLLVLIFLQGESCVCILLSFCTKETHCVFHVDFWLNKSELPGAVGMGAI